MFSSLAAYLFGGSNSNGDTETASSTTNTNIIETHLNPIDLITDTDEEDIKLKVVSLESEEDDQDEWLIVDKDEEESSPQTDSEEEIPFVEIKRRPSSSRHRRVGSGSALSTNSDGIPSLAQGTSVYGISTASCMGESWLVTPPPCFTSTGPVDMVTSPFENLLIEHPSMSVYHRIRSSRDVVADDMTLGNYRYTPIIIPAQYIQHLTPPPSPSENPDDERIALERIVAERVASVRAARMAASRRAERIQATANQRQSREIILARSAQKNYEKKSRQVMGRGAIKRNNQVRELNNKGGRQRRADMQHCKIQSGANNNRKC